MLKFFAEIMWVAFAKATHIFSAKNIRILCTESAETVNEMTLNELVKLTTLWTTGPRCLYYASLASGWFFTYSIYIVNFFQARPLTFTSLCANSADNKLTTFFLIFLENRMLHFMQIVSTGDNLHEMSKLFSGKNKKKIYFKILPAEIFTQNAQHTKG